MTVKTFFLEHSISILEGFLKDHVAMNTSNDAENSTLPSQEYIALSYIKTEKLILHFYKWYKVIKSHAQRMFRQFLSGLTLKFVHTL